MNFFEVEWTPEKIARFWNAYEDTPGMQNWHFSKQRGAALLSWTSKKASICAPVLDLGCGSGHLTSLLLARGIQTYGADVSDNTEKIVTGRFKGDYNFLGFKQIEAGKPLPLKTIPLRQYFSSKLSNICFSQFLITCFLSADAFWPQEDTSLSRPQTRKILDSFCLLQKLWCSISFFPACPFFKQQLPLGFP